VLAITCSLHPGLCPAIRHLPAWRVIGVRGDGLVAVRRTQPAAARPYQVLAITCSLHPGLCPAIRHLPAWRVIGVRGDGLVAVRRTQHS
jgi:hypothetical protein